ncbi:MAG: GNAT family N-acetyltransferase [Saprospiraceae bacterium]|nr:GNAT family N-acetyltransferase [Saprospiraceae bacterium]
MPNKSWYLDWSNQHPKLPVFFLPAWLDATCGADQWDVCVTRHNSGTVLGVLPYHLSKYKMIQVVKMPKLTPYLGPWINIPPSPNTYKWERRYVKVCKDLINQLPNVAFTHMLCHPSFSNSLPFQWKQFTASTRYTFRFNIDDQEPLSIATVDNSVRHNIEMATKQLSIQESGEAGPLYELIEKTFVSKKEPVPFSFEYLTGINQMLVELDKKRIFVAEDANGKLYAAVYIVFDQDTAYCLLIGSDPKLRRNGAVQYLLWHAISWAHQRRLNFDFEGSMLPSIYHSFQDFNPTLIPYYELSRGKNAIFTILGQTMRKRI